MHVLEPSGTESDFRWRAKYFNRSKAAKGNRDIGPEKIMRVSACHR